MDEEEASCNRKHRHDTMFSATCEATRLTLVLNKQFDAYYCNLCQHYHVGSL